MIKYTVILMLTAFLIVSCYKELPTRNDTVYYTPSWSLPIGPLEYSMGDIMPYLSLDFPVPDTSIIPDTIPLILYDDELFFINPPEGHDTTFIEPFMFTSALEDPEYIQNLMIRVNYANGMPINMAYQLYLRDENNLLLDSLFRSGMILVPAGEVNDLGQVERPTTGREEVYFDSNNLQTVLDARIMEVYIFLETYQPENRVLRIYGDDQVSLELATRFELVVPVD